MEQEPTHQALVRAQGRELVRRDRSNERLTPHADELSPLLDLFVRTRQPVSTTLKKATVPEALEAAADNRRPALE